jgi:hypothetical protein
MVKAESLVYTPCKTDGKQLPDEPDCRLPVDLYGLSKEVSLPQELTSSVAINRNIREEKVRIGFRLIFCKKPLISSYFQIKTQQYFSWFKLMVTADKHSEVIIRNDSYRLGVTKQFAVNIRDNAI